MDPLYGGQCQCGALSYECSAPPNFTANCSCRACQRTSGAPYVSVFNVPLSAVRILGDVRRSTRFGDSGRRVESGFCLLCNARLFSFPHSLPGTVNIMAPSLYDQTWYRPAVHIYAAEAPHWHRMDDSIPAFDALPPQRPRAEDAQNDA